MWGCLPAGKVISGVQVSDRMGVFSTSFQRPCLLFTMVTKLIIFHVLLQGYIGHCNINIMLTLLLLQYIKNAFVSSTLLCYDTITGSNHPNIFQSTNEKSKEIKNNWGNKSYRNDYNNLFVWISNSLWQWSHVVLLVISSSVPMYLFWIHSLCRRTFLSTLFS